MAAWLIGGYFIGFGLTFLILLFMAGIASGPNLGGLDDGTATFAILGAFCWPFIVVFAALAYLWVSANKIVERFRT